MLCAAVCWSESQIVKFINSDCCEESYTFFFNLRKEKEKQVLLHNKRRGYEQFI